jgi:hypothetical protein
MAVPLPIRTCAENNTAYGSNYHVPWTLRNIVDEFSLCRSAQQRNNADIYPQRRNMDVDCRGCSQGAHPKQWSLCRILRDPRYTPQIFLYTAPIDLLPADPNHWRLLDDEIVTNIGLPDLDRILIPGEYHRVYMAMYRVDKQHQTTEEQPPHPATTEKPLPPPATAEKILPPPRFAFGTSTGESGASMVQRLMQKRGPGAGFEVAAEPKQVKPVEDEVGGSGVMEEDEVNVIV